jgi:hypothetical protein
MKTVEKVKEIKNEEIISGNDTMFTTKYWMEMIEE